MLNTGELNVKVNALRLRIGEDRVSSRNVLAYDIVLSLDRNGRVRGLKLLLPSGMKEAALGRKPPVRTVELSN